MNGLSFNAYNSITMNNNTSEPLRSALPSLLSPGGEQSPRNILVIENLHLSKGKCLRDESWSESMSVFIVNSGVGRIQFNSGEIHIRENSMLQLPTNRLNAVSWEGQSFAISGVSFTDGFIEEMQFMTELLPTTLTVSSSGTIQAWELNASEHDRVQRQISLLADYTKQMDGPYGKQALAHAFAAFLFDMESLRMRQPGQAALPSSRQEVYVQKFMRLVQQRFRTDRAIKDYADQLNVSAKYLTQLVKQYTGKNASDLITEQVIKEAKSLLLDPQLSIGQIADRLDFSDQSFFGKYFKRQTGISPKIYRSSVLRSGRPSFVSPMSFSA